MPLRRCRNRPRRAFDADGVPREGAQVAELTDRLPATFVGWPPGIRVITCRERPHPGAQLRITDHEGWRITVFATTPTGTSPGRAVGWPSSRSDTDSRAEP